MVKNKILLALSILLLFSCKTQIDGINKKQTEKLSAGEVIINTPDEAGTIGSIDIPAPDFFWMLRPWKQGTLATMDGNARFAEISFTGDYGFRVKALVDFPKQRINGILVVSPDSNLCITKGDRLFFIAETVNKKTKEYMPLASWKWIGNIPRVLDAENQIILINYSASDSYRRNPGYQPCYNIIYDLKNDLELYRSPEEGEVISLYFPITSELIISQKIKNNNINEYIFYNWKTKEIAINDLTKKLNVLGAAGSLGLGYNINLAERYMFTDVGESDNKKKVKITWDENYENVKVISLDYLFPEDKWLYDISISADNKWAATFAGGYKGINGKLLDKIVFFHLDERSPNGISMPIFASGLDNYSPNRGAFVEHPIHGLCYADEIWAKEKGKNKQYLRLYKMSDVLAEINK